MTPQIQSNIREFNDAFRQYMEVTSQTPAYAVMKQSQEFSYSLRKRLRAIAPVKGSIRAERMAAMAAGEEGTHVRASIVERLMGQRGISQKIKGRGIVFGKKLKGVKRVGGKYLNFQAQAVRAELNLREKGRGFVAQSTNFRQLSAIREKLGKLPDLTVEQVNDRYRRFLSRFGFKVTSDGASGLFHWGGNKSSGEVARVLADGRGRDAVAGALADARENMLVYVRRKQEEAKKRLQSVR